MLHVCVGKDAADRETDLELDLGADLELDLDLKCRVWTWIWSLEAANYILLQDIKSYYYIFTSTSQQRSTKRPIDQPTNRPFSLHSQTRELDVMVMLAKGIQIMRGETTGRAPGPCVA